MKNPYKIIKHRHITEKSVVLQNLHTSESNQSVARCQNPKYVFLVDSNASKFDIKEAIETIYASKQVKVVAVNTINVKPKSRRVRGKFGMRAGKKKAIVTLEKGDSLETI